MATGKKKFLYSKYRFIIPLLHFLLSFFYEREIFIFETDNNFINTIAKTDIISDFSERLIGYIGAKIFAFIFIFFLWEMVYFTLRNYRKLWVRLFSTAGVIGGIVSAFIWPNQFLVNVDNSITFSYALRFWPEYWHSVYSSMIYSACMMVVPLPFFIGSFQVIFFVFVTGYLYKRIYESDAIPQKGRFGVYILILMPGIFSVALNPYRTESYALLCMFTVTKIVMDIIDKKASGIKELTGLMLLCGLLAVWRSEGIILGLLSFGVYLIFVQRYKPVKVVLMSIAMTAVFLAFLIPQKIGDIKYYGKDYSFINTFFTLRNVLNSPDSDLSYEGVEEDLAAIEKIVPVSAVKLYGMDGYRRYNYANGRGDINQSLASNEDASAFMKAYWRIVFHNPSVYFRTQYSMIKIIIYIDSPLYVETCNEDIACDLEPWVLKAWETGYLDIYSYSDSDSLSSYSWALYYKLDTIIKWITGVFDKIHLYTIEIMFIVLSEAFILIKELITCFRKRKGNLAFAGLSLVLLIQFFALAAVVPAPTYQYLYGFLYSSFIVIFVYILSGFMKLRNQPHSSENE